MSGYTLALSKNFKARHVFAEKAGTAEGLPHEHDYRVEIQLHGKELDGSGYLIDLEEIDLFLRDVLARCTDVLLNDLPEFSDFPPSLEHFARILCQAVSNRVKRPQIEAVSVKLWESEHAWASFRQDRK